MNILSQQVKYDATKTREALCLNRGRAIVLKGGIESEGGEYDDTFFKQRVAED